MIREMTLMKGNNLHISTLFNSLNKDSAFGSFNLSDYASLKNGSYKKLVKSYYAEQKKTADTDKPVENKKNKVQSADKTGLSQMKVQSDSLKAATQALGKEDLWKQTDGKYNTEKITDAVKSFVKGYNATITQAGKVNSKEIAQDVNFMNGMTSTMSKALSKIGVTVGLDGKMTLNEDSLKKANVSDIKSLFTGTVSYGSQIEGKAGEISRDAVMNSGLYGSNGTLANSIPGMFDRMI